MRIGENIIPDYLDLQYRLNSGVKVRGFHGRLSGIVASKSGCSVGNLGFGKDLEIAFWEGLGFRA